jgi:hypothetical protein
MTRHSLKEILQVVKELHASGLSVGDFDEVLRLRLFGANRLGLSGTARAYPKTPSPASVRP